MDDKSKHKSELLDLLSAAWDNRLDDASRRRLEELLLRRDLPAVELLTSFTRLHLDLEWLTSSKAAQERVLQSLPSAALVGESERRWPRWAITGLATLAAGILIAAFGVWYFSRPELAQLTRMPHPVGQVVRLENSAWAGGERHQAGDTLWEGQTINLERGFAQLSMGFGADLLLEGPCNVRLLSSDRVALVQGKLAVRAARWAVGFEVETEGLVATDLGTWFTMQAGGGRPAEIHVLEGSVSAKPLHESASLQVAHLLNADEAVHMQDDGTFHAVAFRRDGAAEKLNQFLPLRPIQIANTGFALRVGREDPHWKVTAGPDEVGPYPQPTVVSRPHTSYGINEPERSQWISVPRGTTKGVPARSQYTFETTFDLTGFDLSSVRISGLILADDGVDEVWLNGKQLNIPPWSDWTLSYVKFHHIEIRSGFVHGVNRLAFVVKNETFVVPAKHGFDFPETPNPMALRAEWQAFGRPIGDPD